MDEVDTQHVFQANRYPSIPGFGVVRFDDVTQGKPWHDHFHRLQELVSPRGPGLAVLLVSRSLIGRHGQRLLLQVMKRLNLGERGP